ncbi:hypothetical protein CIP107562_00738 [Corynebacterium diphtheriae]|nr:hypothetical protein CIP107562_00738 [Corynebacterium diphtheriae]
MSGTVVIVLIVLVWLFVLAPWLLRGQKPIRKAGEGFDDTRVVYEGGSEQLQPRHHPKVGPHDVHTGYEADSAEHELEYAEVTEVIEQSAEVEEEDTQGPLIDQDPATTLGDVFAHAKEKIGAKRSRGETPNASVMPQVIEGEIVAELPTPEVVADEDSAHDEASLDAVDDGDQVARYDFDDAYVGPDDLMYPSDNDVVTSLDRSEATAEPVLDDDSDLTDEERAFAERRSHRGSWDPESEAQAVVSRQQRRQRTVMGLGAAVIVSLVAAVVFGGWAWAGAGGCAGLLALYLWALRRQVIAEQALRRRRIQQLRRARWGVRNSADEELGIPNRLRRPGAVVLEIDDESPDFEYLDVVADSRRDGQTPHFDGADHHRRVG